MNQIAAPEIGDSDKLRRLLGVVFGSLHAICHALWLGGVIAIGALVAPAIAAVIHNPPPQLDPAILKSTLTTGIIGQALRHFTIVCYVAGVVMLAADAVELATYRGGLAKLLTLARGAATAVLLATAFYLGLTLTPHMDAVLASRNMALFDDLHKQYENIVILVQTPLLILIPVLTSIRNTRSYTGKT